MTKTYEFFVLFMSSKYPFDNQTKFILLHSSLTQHDQSTCHKYKGNSDKTVIVEPEMSADRVA